MASKKISEMSPKATMVDGDLFTIVDSETAVAAEQNKHVLKSTALAGVAMTADLGGAASLDVGTGSGDVATGDAPASAAASAVGTHESTYAHGNLPTVAQKAALNGAATPSGANVFATMADLPGDELTGDELAAIQGAATPSGTNVFATINDLPAAAPVDSVNGATGAVVLDADDISDAATTNKFATVAQLTAIGTAIQPDDDADTLGSGAATDGQVLTADGIGGAAWEDVAAGGGSAVWGAITGTIGDQTDLTPANIGAATAAQGALADTALQPGDADPAGTAASAVSAHESTYAHVNVVSFPVAANSTGNVGDIAFSSNFMAVCLSTNTWYFFPASATRPSI